MHNREDPVTRTHVPYRSEDHRWMGGVCAGLAEYFVVNPFWLRLAFALWFLSNQLAAAVYVLLWVLLPAQTGLQDSESKWLQRNLRDLASEARRWSQNLRALLDRQCYVGPEQARRAVALGAWLTFTGLLLLADNRSLLGPLHLRHLWPLVMILLGTVMLNRALHI